jgi:preprotein translocase subunit SecE
VEKIKKYVRESIGEMRKMTWPTKDEIVGSTIVTVVTCVIVSLFIGIVDRALSFLITFVFATGSA